MKNVFKVRSKQPNTSESDTKEKESAKDNLETSPDSKVGVVKKKKVLIVSTIANFTICSKPLFHLGGGYLFCECFCDTSEDGCRGRKKNI